MANTEDERYRQLGEEQRRRQAQMGSLAPASGAPAAARPAAARPAAAQPTERGASPLVAIFFVGVVVIWLLNSCGAFDGGGETDYTPQERTQSCAEVGVYNGLQREGVSTGGGIIDSIDQADYYDSLSDDYDC